MLVARGIPAEELTYGFIAITKVERDDADPSVRYVYGCATNGGLDTDQQIVDPEFAKKAMAEWYATGGNVRQMHATTLPPAGKGVSLESTPEGEMVRTKVVEPVAVKLVDEGVYTGYSVGIARPRIVRDVRAPGGRITDGKIVELSLVDRPALPTAKFAVLKAASSRSKMAFIGKSVSIGDVEVMADAKVRVPKPGTRVTVMAVGDYGDVRPYEGRIASKGTSSLALDMDGFRPEGGLQHLLMEDVREIRLDKYSPDQPRDDHGRFGSGSGGSSGGTMDLTHGEPHDHAWEKVPGGASSVCRRCGSASATPEQWPRSDSTVKPWLDRESGGEKPPWPGAIPGMLNHATGLREWSHMGDGGQVVGGPPADMDPAARQAYLRSRNPGAYSDGGQPWGGTRSKGILPDLTKGFTHSHSHVGADGVAHRHEHTHASGTPDDHSELHDGGVHAHGHPSTEDSVAQRKQPDTQVDAAPPVDVDAPGAGPDGDGDADDTVQKAGDGVCAKCKGVGDFSSCPACAGTGKAPVVTKKDKAEKALRVVQVADGWSVVKGAATLGTHPDEAAANSQRDAIATATKAAKEAKKASKTTAKAAKAEAKKAQKAAQSGTLPDKGVVEVPWLVRRAHDFACGAYATDAVAAAYPSIEKNGVIGALSGAARSSLYSTLVHEIGGGAGSRGVAALSKALAAIDDILADADAPADLLAARDEVRKEFAQVNPDAAAKPDIYPKPAETITPGQFKRPWISAGHQDAGGTGHSNSIPQTTHPVTAGQFDRGALTEGHQRYLASKVAELHDGIADWRPELCLMDAGGSFAFDRQPASSFDRDPYSAKRVPNEATSAPSPLEIPASRRAPGEKGAVATMTVPAGEPAARVLTPEDLDRALTKAVEPMLTKVAALEATVASQAATITELSAAPDQSRAAYRGMVAPGAQKVATLGGGDDKAQRKAGRGRKQAEKVEYLQSIAQTGDPESQIRARDLLAAMGVES